jgi:hypothetical protein
MAAKWLLVDEIGAHLGVNGDTTCKQVEQKTMPRPKSVGLGNSWRPKLRSGSMQGRGGSCLRISVGPRLNLEQRS